MKLAREVEVFAVCHAWQLRGVGKLTAHDVLWWNEHDPLSGGERWLRWQVIVF